MEDLRQSILYGSLPVEIDFKNYTLAQQYDILRWIVSKPSSFSRIRTHNSPDHWVSVLLSKVATATGSLNDGGSGCHS